MDETYIKVSGRWCYLYWAIDRHGNLLDSVLSEHRDRETSRRFLRRLIDAQGRKPLRLTTDKHPAYTKAMRWIVGRKAQHRQNQYLNNRDGAASLADQAALDGQGLMAELAA